MTMTKIATFLIYICKQVFSIYTKNKKNIKSQQQQYQQAIAHWVRLFPTWHN